MYRELVYCALMNSPRIRAATAAASIIFSFLPAIPIFAATSVPTIMGREEWGADEEYLFESRAKKEVSSGDKGDNGTTNTNGQIDQRVKDCLAMQQAYPDQFKVERTVTSDAKGRKYRWPLQYATSVKLIVVHHSALATAKDTRSGIERMRSLYKYHAVGKGWGDIGYNYVIDHKGQIYEGRLGGERVVAGHAYCNNIGTVGVVLMGNFDIEQPTQEQARSLQWLISDIAGRYNIDLRKPVQFHGKTLPSPVVSHRDLLSTACPGGTLYGGLPQIRSNVIEGRTNAVVFFPEPVQAPSAGSSSSASSVPSLQSKETPRLSEGISILGRTSIAINPAGKQRLSFAYRAGAAGAYEGKKVADVQLSSPDIRLWVDDGLHQIPVTKGILLPYDLPAEDTITFQLIVQAPTNPGNYAMTIGGIRFDLTVSGRRARTGTFINPFEGNPALVVRPKEPTKETTIPTARLRPHSRTSQQSGNAQSSRPQTSIPQQPSSPQIQPPHFQTIRIRLSIDPGVTLAFSDPGSVADIPIPGATTFSLLLKDGECQANYRGERFTSGPLLRFRSDRSNILTVSGVKGFTRSYIGILECRVIDGQLVLINEVSLESYMQGIAEEPDSEPYEKQRAFAIAARSYASYYMLKAYRKFPGKPYDGSDDPATFQAYAGVEYAARNPEWVRAVKSTEDQVLLYNNAPFKPAYFSSDDGRTRTPAEAGWGSSFPNANVFSAKPDPWCIGQQLRGHGVGMSGCGALGQAKEGRSAEQILEYYFPGTRLGTRD